MSGKQSKKVRKERKVSKKVVAGAAAAIIGTAPVVAEGGEFLISVFPHFSFPVVKFDDSLSTGFGGGLQLTYRPNPYFNIFLQGDYKQYTFDTKQDIGNIGLISGTIGGGYHLPISDRLGLDINAGIGYYNSTYQRGQGNEKSSSSVQGLNVTGGIFLSYKINPTISVFAGADANHYAYKNSKFITSADITPGLTFNITKAFSNKTNVSVEQDELKPVFPVFYSWYNENPFGSVAVTNNEDVTITDVNVYFFQPQYMNQPKECGKRAALKQGESFSVDLRAFFNEQMLELNEKNDTMSTIIVEYKYLGKKSSASFPMVVPVYGRNNMSWEDDRCASAFVSSKDPAAMWFAKYVVSTIRENIRSGLTTNIQYAMGIFDALDQFGINYVKDPTSAFEDNVGTASIDFLQFPYQTLMYRGGDCDDLSILVCSLLESVGIKTAFITIPGHIFMAFDSGFTVEEAKEYFLTLDEFIVDGNKVWVPLEITLSDEGFNKAWHKGAWEWNTAARTGDAMLYKMEDSWKVYKPVNVPGAVARFSLPEETYVARLFSHSVDEFIIGQIMPQIAFYENRIAMNPTAQNYNDFGVLYARYGLFEQAEKQFRLARNLDYKPSVLNTANIYYSIKDYERATNWYKEVLKNDSDNHLAMIGLARCAYEVGNYKECDYWYGTVFNKDIELARKYSYLGAFQSTSGRSFSLADRLENTVWISSSSDTSVVKPVEEALQPVENQVATQTTDVQVKTTKPEAPAESLEDLAPLVAVVPTNIEEEKEPEVEEDKTEGGDGDDTPDTETETQSAVAEAPAAESEAPSAVAEDDTTQGVIPVLDTGIYNGQSSADLRVKPEDDTKLSEATTQSAVVEPVETTSNDPQSAVVEALETTTELDTTNTQVVSTSSTTEELTSSEPEVYVGISNELNVNFISVEELVALAEDTIKEYGETIEDISIPVDDTQDFEAYVEENAKELAVAETSSVVDDTPSAVVEPVETTSADTTNAVAETQNEESEAQNAVVEALETTTELDTANTQVVSTSSTNASASSTTASVSENTTELDASTNELAIEKLEANPASSTSSVTTDVPLRAVPRFTVQPSAEWAPESAYTAETIPGMKPFEEEMGNYQNEKAFLYKESEFDFAINPGEEIKEEEKKETTIELAALEVNPFSSFLSEEEAEKIEEITSFRVEEVAEAAKASTSDEDIPMPEVIPQPKLAVAEETAVALPLVDDRKSSADNTTSGAVVEAQNAVVETQNAVVEPVETTKEIETTTNLDTTNSQVVSTSSTTPNASSTTPNASSTTPNASSSTTNASSSTTNDKSTTPVEDTKKSKGIIFGAIAALAAAAAAVFIVKRRKSK